MPPEEVSPPPPVDAAVLLELLPEMVLVIGEDLAITYANQRLFDLMGSSAAQ